MLPVYYIYLKRSYASRGHRLEKMLQRRKDYLLKTKIDAVDGLALTRKQVDGLVNNRISRNRHGRLLKLTEIACSLSHALALGQFLASSSSHSTALILEDDAEIIASKERMDGLRTYFQKHFQDEP